MTLIDWLLVFLLNGSVIAYALWRGRDTDSSDEWFLAGRTLPWWMIGLSLYATTIDSTDLIVDSGAVYDLGLRHFVLNWVGVIGGWFLLAHWIAPPMYRAGMFTNAEYLEARFGVTARVISVFVQILYRTVIVGMIATTNYLTLVIVCEWSPTMAWTTVVCVALIATIYTMVGGLKSVAITDSAQSVIMFIAGLTLFVVVYNSMGGWTGMEQKLKSHDQELALRMLHAGSTNVWTTSTEGMSSEELAKKMLLGGQYDRQRSVIEHRSAAWLTSLTLIIAGVAYSIVNHTQTMRLFGARSLWDLKMAIVPAGLILVCVTFVNHTMGLMGKALYPGVKLLPVEPALQKIDAIYPIMVRDFTTVGLKGIVVAGLFAAAFSTYDSIGSALSALITRDVYARLLAPNKTDSHYLAVGRWITPIIVFGSFIYIPALLAEGMIFIYLDVVGAFVVPLLVAYLMGIFTRVHRKAATIGLLVGGLYGVATLVAPWLAEEHGVMILPAVVLGRFITAPVSLLLTSGTMVVVSLVLGWQDRHDLLHQESSPWLRESQQHIAQRTDTSRESPSRVPLVCSLLVLGVGAVLSFVVFW
jgi:SSS family solute:Na+ symporter